jgi:hypothetical protein
VVTNFGVGTMAVQERNLMTLEVFRLLQAILRQSNKSFYFPWFGSFVWLITQRKILYLPFFSVPPFADMGSLE